jgi:hypothetical protein
MKLAVGAILAAALWAAPAAAQETKPPEAPPKAAVDSAKKRAGDEIPPGTRPAVIPPPNRDTVFAPNYDADTPWLLSYFPYVTGGYNDGPAIAFRARYWQPAQLGERVTYKGAITASAGVAIHGSRFATLQFAAPQFKEHWRLAGELLASQDNRFGFFGLGNGTVRDETIEKDPALRDFYRARRTRYQSRAEVSRQISGPLFVGLSGQAVRARFRAPDGPSLFQSEFGPVNERDEVSGRLALVVDERDNEFNTRRGFLLEAGAQLGRAGPGFHRFYGVARGYLPISARTVLAARILGSDLGGTPTLNSRFEVPTWEQPVGVLGGSGSHRALVTGRFAGTGVLLGNFEVRHDLLIFGGGLGQLGVLAFVDAGRVFEGEKWRFTTRGLKVGGGGGLAFRVLRSTIVTAVVARGPDGTRFQIANGWMF